MKKIVFFLQNKTLDGADFTKICNGNPGVGGSEYMIVLIATLLSQRDNGISVRLLTEKDGLFPQVLEYEIVGDIASAIHRADCDGTFDYFIFKHNREAIEHDLLHAKSKMEFIPWCHNFASHTQLKYYANNNSVASIVNVGREQMDLYRDNLAFKKSVYIFNCVDIQCLKRYDIATNPFAGRPHNVTYIGSIIPAKGLHWLAEAWEEVLRQVPDAQLYIIGSGKLYSRNAVLGPFGIAEKNYEGHLMKYLSKDGEILPCVHFMGIMGEEKNKVLLNTKVGVPNPSGESETFGISAVEMQIMGAKVTTIRCAGYIDTVKNGLLYNKKKQLATSIIKLLQSTDSDYDATIEYFDMNFSQEAVVQRWETLILNGYLPQEELTNSWFHLKWMKELMRIMKEKISCLYIIPDIERFYNLRKRITLKKHL